MPGFGDELDGSKHRVLPNGGEKGGVAVKAVRTAAERGGEIEPETVDVTDLDPVTQQIHHHLQDTRMGKGLTELPQPVKFVVVARGFPA